MFGVDDLKLFFQGFIYRDKAKEIIVEAERITGEIGVFVGDVLADINREIKNPLVSKAVRVLRRTGRRSMAYRHIFDKEVIELLKAVEDQKLSPNLIFMTFIDIKRKIDKYFSRFRTKTKGLLVGTIAFYLGGLYFVHILHEMGIKELDPLLDFADKFKFLIMIPIVIFVLFNYKPIAVRFNPLYRSVYFYFRALYLLSIYDIGTAMGLNSPDILNIYRKLDPDLKSILKRVPNNIEGIATALKKYLTGVERLLLIKAVRGGTGDKFIKLLFEKRMNEVENKVEFFLETFDEFAPLVQLIFVGYIAFIFLKFMNVMLSISMGSIKIVS